MEKKTYTKEEKDKILDDFRKRVLWFFIAGPIIVAVIISVVSYYIFSKY